MSFTDTDQRQQQEVRACACVCVSAGGGSQILCTGTFSWAWFLIQGLRKAEEVNPLVDSVLLEVSCTDSFFLSDTYQVTEADVET